MAYSQLQKVNQLLASQLRSVEEERDHDVKELQERITFLEKREQDLQAELEWTQQVLRGENGGETTAILTENTRLRKKIEQLEISLLSKEKQLKEREMGSPHDRVCGQDVDTETKWYLNVDQQERRQQRVKVQTKYRQNRSQSVEVVSIQPRAPEGRASHQYKPPLQDIATNYQDTATAHHQDIPSTPVQDTSCSSPKVARALQGQGRERCIWLSWSSGQHIREGMVRGGTAYHKQTGEIYFNCPRSPYIYNYNPQKEEWARLQPPNPHLFCGLAIVQGQVVTVGGQRGPDITAALLTRGEGEGEEGGCWLEQLPPMPTACFNLTTSCTGDPPAEKLLAIGGVDTNGPVSCVQVLHVEERQWTQVAHLPHPADSLSICGVLGNQLYLMGGTNSQKVYTCYIPYLMKTTPTDTKEVWFELPDTPTTSCTGVVVANQLLCVGGYDKKGQDSNGVFHLQQETRTWKGISNMNIACNKPLLAYMASSSKLMVLGGSTKVSHMINAVQTATIALSNI